MFLLHRVNRFPNWDMKINMKDKYLYCPIPKAGWSSWKRLWFYTSGHISSYDTDVGITDDKKANVRDIRGLSAMKAAWRSHKYTYSFVFFR